MGEPSGVSRQIHPTPDGVRLQLPDDSNDLGGALDVATLPGDFVWVGLHEPSQDEMELVALSFGLHRLAVEDAVVAHQRPKLERYDGDVLFMILKTLWYVDDLLENQWLILERFADLPVILCAAPVSEKNGTISYKIVVIEKDQGAVRFNKGIPNNGNYFQHMTVDLKSSEINLHRYDLRIRVTPADLQPGKN